MKILLLNSEGRRRRRCRFASLFESWFSNKRKKEEKESWGIQSLFASLDILTLIYKQMSVWLASKLNQSIHTSFVRIHPSMMRDMQPLNWIIAGWLDSLDLKSREWIIAPSRSSFRSVPIVHSRYHHSDHWPRWLRSVSLVDLWQNVFRRESLSWSAQTTRETNLTHDPTIRSCLQQSLSSSKYVNALTNQADFTGNTFSTLQVDVKCTRSTFHDETKCSQRQFVIDRDDQQSFPETFLYPTK